MPAIDIICAPIDKEAVKTDLDAILAAKNYCTVL